MKEENHLSRACSFYWSSKEKEQELICVSVPLFLYLFNSKGSLYGKQPLSNVVGCLEWTWRGGTARNMMCNQLSALWFKRRAVFYFTDGTLCQRFCQDSLFPDINRGLWNQKVKLYAVLEKLEEPAQGWVKISSKPNKLAVQPVWDSSESGLRQKEFS